MGKILVTVLSLFFFGDAYASAPPPTPVVTVTEAKLSDLVDQLTYPSRVESLVNSMIYAESDGVVTKILAPLGTKVKKGSPIAVIKHTDPVYQYAPMTLVSQVPGVVSQVAVTEGSTLNKGALVASVTSPDQLKIVIEVAASDLSSFKTGMVGEFSVSGATEKFKVKIKGVSPFVDPSTGAAECDLVVLDKGAENLHPGSVGQVEFNVNPRKGFVFPESAVVYKGDKTYVRVVQNGVAKRILVTLGRRERGKVEILQGLKDGDKVIERASQFVGDGDHVQVESGGAGNT